MSPFYEFNKKVIDGIVRHGHSPKAKEKDLSRTFLKTPRQDRRDTATVSRYFPRALILRAKAQDLSYGETPPPKEEAASRMEKPVQSERKEKSLPEEGIIITDIEADKNREEQIERFRPAEPVEWQIKRPLPSRPLWWGVGSGFLLLLIAVILISTVFSRLTLTLKPRVEVMDINDVVVTFDTSVSKVLPDIRVIPAERMELAQTITEEFESTGKEFIEERARGTVKIYNRFSSSPQRLAASTRFLTDSGLLYRLPQPILLPGAKIEEGTIVPQFLEAELLADTPGEETNIKGETTLRLPGFQGSPKYEGFYAVAPSGFEGGFKGEARVVSKDDIAAAEALVTKKAFDVVRNEIARKIPPTLKLLEGYREIQISKVEAPPLGIRRERFSVAASAVGQALVFREEELKKLLETVLLGGDTARTLIDEGFSLEYHTNIIDLDKGRAAVSIRGKAKAEAVLKREEIANSIRGKKEGSLIEALKNRKDLAAFNVAFFPPWLFSAPKDQAKIRVVVESE